MSSCVIHAADDGWNSHQCPQLETDFPVETNPHVCCGKDQWVQFMEEQTAAEPVHQVQHDDAQKPHNMQVQKSFRETWGTSQNFFYAEKSLPMRRTGGQRQKMSPTSQTFILRPLK